MESYRSLVAWQRASALCMATLETVDEQWHPRAGALFEQLRRATISADINLVEGYALGTPALFRRHVRIALGSAVEAQRLIQIAGARGYIDSASTQELGDLADASVRVLFGLLRSPRLRPR